MGIWRMLFAICDDVGRNNLFTEGRCKEGWQKLYGSMRRWRKLRV